MSPMAWLLLVLTSPLWLGWLYLPWRQWRNRPAHHRPPRPRLQGVALAVLLLWFVLLWRAPPDLILQAIEAIPVSAAAWRTLPALGLLALGPLWGAVLVCCPEALRDTLADVTCSAPLPVVWLQAIGWGLMALGAVVYGALSMGTR